MRLTPALRKIIQKKKQKKQKQTQLKYSEERKWDDARLQDNAVGKSGGGGYMKKLSVQGQRRK